MLHNFLHHLIINRDQKCTGSDPCHWTGNTYRYISPHGYYIRILCQKPFRYWFTWYRYWLFQTYCFPKKNSPFDLLCVNETVLFYYLCSIEARDLLDLVTSQVCHLPESHGFCLYVWNIWWSETDSKWYPGICSQSIFRFPYMEFWYQISVH